MNIIEHIEQMVQEKPDLAILKLTRAQAEELHLWLSTYHKQVLPPFVDWIEKNPVFLGRKIQVYAPEENNE